MAKNRHYTNYAPQPAPTGSMSVIACSQHPRLLLTIAVNAPHLEEDDSEFDPIVTLVWLGFSSWWRVRRGAPRPCYARSVVWILAGIPLVMGVVGFVILVRENQLWEMRSPRGHSQ